MGYFLLTAQIVLAKKCWPKIVYEFSLKNPFCFKLERALLAQSFVLLCIFHLEVLKNVTEVQSVNVSELRLFLAL